MRCALAERELVDGPLPVAVVVVSWNSAHVIGRCLTAAVAQNPAEIVVVDNASQDATCHCIVQDFEHVCLLRQGHNTGFATGSNIGIAATRAPYVLLLNDDAELQPGYLRHLVAALAADGDAASAVGKLVCRKNGVLCIDSAGIKLDTWALRPLDRGHGEPDIGQYDRAERVFGPSGAGALFRRSALQSLSSPPFDASFFAYYEDVDLAWRLQHAGWHHLYEPAAVAFHDRRGPAQKPLSVRARAFVNRYSVWLKNESLRRFVCYAPVALPWEAARLARLALREPHFLRHIAIELPAAVRRGRALRQ